MDLNITELNITAGISNCWQKDKDPLPAITSNELHTLKLVHRNEDHPCIILLAWHAKILEQERWSARLLVRLFFNNS
jgi:hypothetical protein